MGSSAASFIAPSHSLRSLSKSAVRPQYAFCAIMPSVPYSVTYLDEFAAWLREDLQDRTVAEVRTTQGVRSTARPSLRRYAERL